MFKKKSEESPKADKAKAPESGLDASTPEGSHDEAATPECCHEVHSDHVALPEVRTGEMDAEDDFAKTQDELSKKKKHRLSLEAVAVPEFHTGKVSAQEAREDAEEEAAEENGDGKKHHLLGDLVHTLLNGKPE